MAPADFAIIYDVKALYDTNIDGTSIDGTGQSIAVLGQTDLYNGGSDIRLFAVQPAFRQIHRRSRWFRASPIPALSREISTRRRSTWSGRGRWRRDATINFINGGSEGVFTQALKYAVNNPNLGSVISISYGQCEQPPIGMDVSSFQSLATRRTCRGKRSWLPPAIPARRIAITTPERRSSQPPRTAMRLIFPPVRLW